VWITWG